MRIYILAVTKAFDKFCIAGIDEQGNWVRPIPNSHSTRFWNFDELVFNQKYGFIRSGDVIEFKGMKPSKYLHPNHTEDIIVVSQKITLIKRLTNQELINFLKGKEESEQSFNKTVNAQKRSLCLIKVDGFQHHITQYQAKPARPKMTFINKAFNVTNPKTNKGDYIVKDCKWSNLVLNNFVSNNQNYSDIYLTLGLATPTNYDGEEYPQVIGLHTNPEIPFPINYPN